MPIVYHKFTQKSSYFRGKSSSSINTSKNNGLHKLNLRVIFLILTYFVSRVLLQKLNTCQPLPRSKVIHRFSKVVGNLWITYACLWKTQGATLARSLLVLTSVWTCVGPFGPAFISRACATNIQHGSRSIVQMCEYLL